MNTGLQEGYMERLFNSTVTLVAEVYGSNAFRRWNGKGYDKAISLRLSDSLMLTTAQRAESSGQRPVRGSL